jgi:hypothetical protein
MSRPFTRIFKADHDKALTLGHTALLVYTAILRVHSDAPVEAKSQFPAGAARIARHCGLSTRQVKRNLPQLADEKLITIKSGRRADRKGKNEENLITLLGVAGQVMSRDSESPEVGTGKSVQNGPRKKKLSQEREKEKKRQSAESAGAGAPASSAGAKEDSKTWSHDTL